MSYCMVPSLLVGGGVAWVLSKMVQERQRIMEIEVLRETLEVRDRQFKKLQERYQNQEIKLNKITDEGIVTRHQLLQKSNLLRKTSDRLYRLQSQLENLERLEQEKSKLIEELTRLKTLLEEKNRTIKEFEAVLIKADNLLSKQHLNHPKSSINLQKHQLLEFEIEKLKKLVAERNRKILQYEKEIQALKEEQQNDESFLISKDQFREIEKRLIEYKSRIEILEAENQSLIDAKVPKNRLKEGISSNLQTWLHRAKGLLTNQEFEANSLKRQQELNNI